MTTTDEWVTAALTDDAVVAQLLFRLKQSSSPSSSASSPPLRWGHRQPRSKPTPPAASASTTISKKEPSRCSPTTPLSWSYGAGDSSPAAADGSDESSRPSDRSDGSRSDKGDFTNDSMGTINKRSRKKKTFAELRDEENSLLKERIHLKKEISTVRVTIKEQKVRSENFKRIKLDPHLDSPTTMSPNSSRPTFSRACTPAHHVSVSPMTMHQEFAPMDSFKAEEEVETTERCFVLPDLNMMPSEEDSLP